MDFAICRAATVPPATTRRRQGARCAGILLVAVACAVPPACGTDGGVGPLEPPPGGGPPTVEPPEDPTFVQVASGLGHACALDDAGVVHCWGENEDGQLGLGNGGTGVLEPTPIETDVEFVAVVVGDAHSCALAADGTAHCWGGNDFGQLGDGTTAAHGAPTPVSGAHVFTALTAAGTHTCGIVSPSESYCWGDNSFGQLGAGSASGFSSAPLGIVLELEGQDLVLASIDAGSGHTCALDNNGAPFCWGNNGTGQFGNGSTRSSDIPEPAFGGSVFDFTWISAGGVHTCAGSSGPVSCWGFNLFGQLGDGTNEDNDSPDANSVIGDLDLVLLSAGSDHTCGLTPDGVAYCWGFNGGGRLGDGTESDRNAPTAVSGGHQFVDISAGVLHTCGVTADGALYCWGRNEAGQLGNGTLDGSLEPVQVAHEARANRTDWLSSTQHPAQPARLTDQTASHERGARADAGLRQRPDHAPASPVGRRRPDGRAPVVRPAAHGTAPDRGPTDGAGAQGPHAAADGTGQ